MQLNDDVHVLALPMVRDGETHVLNVSLILDADQGPTLVDAGLPGQMDAIETALGEAGLTVADLRRIFLTHQDIDHIGSEFVLATDWPVDVYGHDHSGCHNPNCYCSDEVA